MIRNYPQVKTINFMSSNICNAYCKCCQYRETHKDNFAPMSDHLWNKIIMEFYKFKSIDQMKYRIKNESFNLTDFVIHFGWLDEPLCDPKIISRVKDLRILGFKHVGIITNCSLLTRDRLHELYDAGVTEFYLSLLSADKKEYEALTGLNFELVVANIFGAVKYLENKNVLIKINAPLTKPADKNDFEKLFPPHILKYVFFNMKDHREKKYKTEKIKWNESCFHMMTGKNNINGCDVGISRFLILHNGDVPLCPLDFASEPIGNIDRDGLWHLIKLQTSTIMNRNKPGKEPICCQNCYIP